MTEQISFRDLVLKMRWIRKFLMGRWIIILSVSILVGGLCFLYALLKQPRYLAKLTFVVEDSKSSALNSYAGLASQFGLDLGGNSNSGIFNGDNIMAFLESRLMVSQTLLTDTFFEGKPITLGDLYIETIGWKGRWKEAPLQGFSFPLHSSVTSLTRLQDSVMDLLCMRITQKDLSISKPDKKLNFISVEVTSVNEMFSKLFAERLLIAASDFYIATKTVRAHENMDNLQKQADSLLLQLDKTTLRAAVNQDINLNPIKKVGQVESEGLTRDKTILTSAYSEVARNLGMAKITLAQETPVIQVVDFPTWPLSIKKASRLIFLVAGFIMGGLLTSLALLTVKFYKELA